ncbi:FAD-binding protein [Lactobacillus delbrueckii]|uniref:FAD-binding protein n=1 Tax=Lactobacillus delbrueckii TaxID=1584 RepID=UPI001F1C6D33|nr:FAD-binding protein [Lactobacillus delbrueckii]GHN29528.1 hypothetical protein ME789_05130 [Lactobacillus delbrueckii]
MTKLYDNVNHLDTNASAAYTVLKRTSWLWARAMQGWKPPRPLKKLAETWADNSGATLDWLEEKVLKPHGAHLRAEADAMVTNKAYQAFPTENDPTFDDQSFTSYGDWFLEYQEKYGVDLRFETILVNLIKEAGRVTGALVKDLVKDEYYQIKAKKGVILTTGGYSANVDLLKEWNPLSLKKNVYNDSPRSNGAGITSALNVGAIRDEEPAETIFDRGLVPVGKKTEDMYYQTATYDHWLWIGSYPFLKVNLRGERFANESVPYQFIVNAAAKEPGYLYAMIWDDNYAETLEKVHMLGCARYGFPGYMKDKEAFVADTEQHVKDGLVVKADTLEELAEKLNLPADKLKEAVANNNQAVIEFIAWKKGEKFDMIEAKKSARNKLQKMERKEQHYSFRKVNTGLASVLLGFSLSGLAITFTPGKVAAADNTAAEVTTT